MCSVEYGTCRWPVEKLAGFTLVGSSIFQAWVELFLSTLEAWHAIRPACLHEVTLARLFGGECSEEVHEISLMISCFHPRILARFLR